MNIHRFPYNTSSKTIQLRNNNSFLCNKTDLYPNTNNNKID